MKDASPELCSSKTRMHTKQNLEAEHFFMFTSSFDSDLHIRVHIENMLKGHKINCGNITMVTRMAF